MPIPTKTDLENMKQDIADLEQVVNAVENTDVQTRLGKVHKSLTGRMAELQTKLDTKDAEGQAALATAKDKLARYAAINYTGDFVASTAYEANDVWKNTADGSLWIVPADYTSGATAQADIDAKAVRPHQDRDRVEQVKSLEELKLVVPAYEGQLFYLSAGGRYGTFETLPAGDYSAEIEADQQEGDYVLLDDGQTLKRKGSLGINTKITHFGVTGVGDETTKAQAALDLVEFIGGGRVYADIDFEFSSLTIGANTLLYYPSGKSREITSNLVSGDAVTVVGGAGAFWNGIEGIRINSTAARQAGAGRGLVIDSQDTNTVAFKCKAIATIVNNPGVSFDAVQPEHCDIDVVTINGGDIGCRVSAPNNKGIANSIRLRSINCAGKPIDIKTFSSDINSVEALVENDSLTYTGVLCSISGDGNTITSTDSELNGNPTDANIMLCTGVELLGDNNTLIGGYIGNCGKSIDVGGRGNKVLNPKLSIYSTLASPTVVGSVGVSVRSGAEKAKIEYDTSGASKIETDIEDLASDTVLISEGKINGLGKVITATVAWDPASMASGGIQTTTVSVAGAVLGSPAIAGHTGLTSGIGGNNKVSINAFAINGSVIVKLHNDSGVTVDVPSGTLTVKVFT